MKVPIQSLIELVTPPKTPVENRGDWAHVEQQLGTSLPDDYKTFVSVYGTGTICDQFIRVLNPFSEIGFMNLLECGRGTLERYQKDKMEGKWRVNSYPVYPEPSGVLPWGTSANGHEMFWLTHGDPNHWGVVFNDHGSIECRTYERVCMTQFLVTMLSGQLDGGKFKIPEFLLQDQPRFRTPNDLVDPKVRKERWKKWKKENETGQASV
jgi:hypothetical protein